MIVLLFSEKRSNDHHNSDISGAHTSQSVRHYAMAAAMQHHSQLSTFDSLYSTLTVQYTDNLWSDLKYDNLVTYRISKPTNGSLLQQSKTL